MLGNDNRLKWQAYGIAALRMVVGLVFLAHGSQKLFVYGLAGTAGAFAKMGIPVPEVSAALVMMAEFVGGAALLLGFATRLAAIPVAFTMVVAILSVHLKNGFFAPAGIEYPLTLLVANCALILTGSGACALDNLRLKAAHRSPLPQPAR